MDIEKNETRDSDKVPDDSVKNVKLDIGRKIFFGSSVVLIISFMAFLGNCIMGWFGYEFTYTLLLTLTFAGGVLMPQYPESHCTCLSSRMQMKMTIIFIGLLFFLYLATFIHCIGAYATIPDSVEDFCEKCYEEKWRCAEQCVDDHTYYEKMAYVANTFLFVLSPLVWVIFTKWAAMFSQCLIKSHPELEDFKDSGKGPNECCATSLPYLDPYFCCFCPGQQKIACCDESDVEGVKRICFAFCNSPKNFACLCCCFFCFGWIVLVIVARAYCWDEVEDDAIARGEDDDFAEAICWIDAAGLTGWK